MPIIGRITRLAGATALAVATMTAAPRAEPDQAQTIQSVQRALARLPYFGVFDFIAFKVDKGVVTLQGFAYRPQLPKEAAQAVKRAAYVDEVVNEIEVLPASNDDDRIRFAEYYGIYQDDFLSRYVPGGPMAAAFGLMSFARFPGMQPFGVHAVHIVVKHRRVMLFGVVDSAGDRVLVDVRSRQVPGVLELENNVVVR